MRSILAKGIVTQQLHPVISSVQYSPHITTGNCKDRHNFNKRQHGMTAALPTLWLASWLDRPCFEGIFRSHRENI